VRTETESLLKEKRVDPKNVCVLGFSQGGVRAFQAAFKAPHIFNGLICVSGALDDEALGMENLKAGAGIVSTALFHGRGDKLMTCDLAEYAENLLKTANCRVRLLLYEGEHRFPADYQKMFTDALQWIKQADKQPR
jgi:phospholipase/carboxylesterase